MSSGRSLKQQINLILLVVTILAFFVAGGLTAIRQYKQGLREAKEVMRSQANIVKNSITTNLAIEKERFEIFGIQLQGRNSEEIIAHLRTSLYPTIMGNIVYVLDPEGRVVLINSEFQQFMGFDLSKMPYRKKIDYISSSYQSVFSGSAVVAMVYPLPEGYSLVVERDVLVIMMQMDMFSEEFVVHGVSLFVMDQEGKATYHQDKNIVRSRHNLAFDFKEETPQQNGLVSVSYHNLPCYIYREELSVPIGWQVVLLMPLKYLLDNLKAEVQFQLIIIFIFCVTLAIIFGFFLNILFSNPVHKIVDSLNIYEREQVGNPIPVFTSFDIQELQQISAAVNRMAQSLKRYRLQLTSILDSMDALIYVADMHNYEVLFINASGRKLWGDIQGHICWQVLQEGQDGPCPFCTNDRLLDLNGQPKGTYSWECQNTITKKWYEHRDQAIPWSDGRLVRMEISIDVSNRKKMEKEILDNEMRYRAIFEQGAVGVAEVDSRTGRFLNVNRYYCEMVGYSEKEMLTRHFQDITHPDDLAEDLQNMLNVREGKINEFSMEKRYIRKDGSIIWGSIFVSPLWSAGQEPFTHIVIVQDISVRKDAELVLQNQHLELEKIVAERTLELENKNKELEKLNRYYVDREFRIKELKMVIARLKRELRS